MVLTRVQVFKPHQQNVILNLLQGGLLFPINQAFGHDRLSVYNKMVKTMRKDDEINDNYNDNKSNEEKIR